MGHKYDVLLCNSTVEETEEYLKTLVREHYSQDNCQKISEALNLARSAHANQYRCNGDPYIHHPMRVALMLLRFDNNTISKVLIAALLHDTIEKTEITSDKIAAQFGEYVAKLVRSVTREHDERQSPQEKTELKYRNWLEIMSSSHEVRMIKVCEDLENMVCWKSISANHPSQEKIERWLMEASSMSLPLAKTTNLEIYDVMRKEYLYYVERGYTHQTVVC